MVNKKFNYIYGPVPSWRLGSSLGIDPLSQTDKICNFNCIYCQIGKTIYYTDERKLYISTQNIIDEIKQLPANVKINFLTFSGRGEPTLASNLGEAIKALRKIRQEAIAVITNASLIDKKDVRDDLKLADFVIAKLDANSQEQLQEINNPSNQVKFTNILQGLQLFSQEYSGKLALQMMFIDINQHCVEEFIQLAYKISPDEIQINTPLRPSAVVPLSKKMILEVKKRFESQMIISSKGRPTKIISVYDEDGRIKTIPISDIDTMKRRGKIYDSQKYN